MDQPTETQTTLFRFVRHVFVVFDCTSDVTPKRWQQYSLIHYLSASMF